MNHMLPCSNLLVDHSYKETSKLSAHFDSKCIGVQYAMNEGRNSSNRRTKRFYLKTDPSQLTEEEKKENVWDLAEKDARVTHPVMCNMMGICNEFGLPMEFLLSDGMYIH